MIDHALRQRLQAAHDQVPHVLRTAAFVAPVHGADGLELRAQPLRRIGRIPGKQEMLVPKRRGIPGVRRRVVGIRIIQALSRDFIEQRFIRVIGDKRVVIVVEIAGDDDQIARDGNIPPEKPAVARVACCQLFEFGPDAVLEGVEVGPACLAVLLKFAHQDGLRVMIDSHLLHGEETQFRRVARAQPRAVEDPVALAVAVEHVGRRSGAHDRRVPFDIDVFAHAVDGRKPGRNQLLLQAPVPRPSLVPAEGIRGARTEGNPVMPRRPHNGDVAADGDALAKSVIGCPVDHGELRGLRPSGDGVTVKDVRGPIAEPIGTHRFHGTDDDPVSADVDRHAECIVRGGIGCRQARLLLPPALRPHKHHRRPGPRWPRHLVDVRIPQDYPALILAERNGLGKKLPLEGGLGK